MKAYVLNAGYDYEGESTLGVFYDIASAEAAAHKDCDDPEQPLEYRQHRTDFIELNYPCSSKSYYIYEFEVKGTPSK